MGYSRKGTILQLVFEDPEMEGLVVQAKKPSMGGMLDTVSFQDLANIDPTRLSPQDAKRLREMFEFFGAFLVKWNLEDEDGTPIPCNIDGLLSQDAEFVLSIITAWLGVVGNIATPLKEGSNNGQQSEVASIPTETLSANLGSLPVQS